MDVQRMKQDLQKTLELIETAKDPLRSGPGQAAKMQAEISAGRFAALHGERLLSLLTHLETAEPLAGLEVPLADGVEGGASCSTVH